MKFVKLFICFAVFLAVIVVAVNFSKGVATKGLNGVDNEYVQKYDSIINAQWGEDDAVWSSENFEDMKSKLYARRGEFGNIGHRNLLETLDRLALRSLYKATIAEYGKPDCEEERIEELSSDLEKYFPSEDEKNATVKKLHDLNRLYKDALKMCSKFSKIPKFNKDAPEDEKRWEDINKFKDEKKNKRQEIMNNGLYRYICNIEKIKLNFSEYKFNEKLNQAETDFKNDLSSEIYEAFKNDVPKLEDVAVSVVHYNDDLEAIKRDREEVKKIRNSLVDVRDDFKLQFGEAPSFGDPPTRVNDLIKDLDVVLDKYNDIIKKSEEYINSQN